VKKSGIRAIQNIYIDIVYICLYNIDFVFIFVTSKTNRNRKNNINKSKKFTIMKVTEFTKLSTLAVKPVVEALQQLLADYQIYYSNLRGLHWNVKGKEFFVLHAQFENMYDNVATKIDEIAERILMLDGIPAHNYSEYLKTSNVKELGYISNGDEGVTHVMETISHFVTAERTILSLASEVGDETTVAMMSDYIKEQEKLLWMLVAYKS